MPQNKEVHKEYMRKYRQGSQEGSQGSQTEYPAIIRALIDPIKREKLEKIHQSLKEHKVLREVRYGTSGPTFELIGDMLEATG